MSVAVGRFPGLRGRGVRYPSLDVACFALLSRVVIIFIQVICTNLFPDHEADAFHLDPVDDPSTSDKAVHLLIGGFTKWDASYFLHIAHHGYTSTQMFAFFPLYPCLVRTMADSIIQPLQYASGLHMSLLSCIVTASVLLNILTFCITAVVLYHLSVQVLYDRGLAYKAALLFCINPASVFMSAAYTESLFAMVSFAGMLCVEHNRIFLAALVFASSGAVRSNGIVSAGFLLYVLMKRTVAGLAYVLAMVQGQLRLRQSLLWNVTYHYVPNILKTIAILPCCIFVILPFVLFQMYSFMIICSNQRDFVSFLTMMTSGHEGPVASGDSAPSWCLQSMPLPYAAIQSHHWNVGFLKYYELKQLPNFLLALPMVVLCGCAIVDYCQCRWSYVRILGLYETEKQPLNGKPLDGIYSSKALVYVIHSAALLVFGVTCMHVQVVTRFITSSCPVVFWYAAHITSDSAQYNAGHSHSLQEQQQQQQQLKQQKSSTNVRQDNLFSLKNNPVIIQYMNWYEQSLCTHLVLCYFAAYCIIGTCMHCNFLPWT